MLRKVARRRTSSFWGSRGPGRSNRFPYLFFFCQRLVNSFSEFCRTVLNSKLDTLFGSFLDLEHVAFYICLYECLLVFEIFLQYADVLVISTARIKCFPNWFVSDGVESFREVDRRYPHFNTPLRAFLFNHPVRRKVVVWYALLGPSPIFSLFLVESWIQSCVQNRREQFVQRRQWACRTVVTYIFHVTFLV